MTCFSFTTRHFCAFTVCQRLIIFTVIRDFVFREYVVFFGDSILIIVNILWCEHRNNKKDFWIGLYKATDTTWYDGNPSAYRNWATGKPSTTGKCVLYTDDGFMDKNCDKQHHYICKKGAGCYSRHFTADLGTITAAVIATLPPQLSPECF